MALSLFPTSSPSLSRHCHCLSLVVGVCFIIIMVSLCNDAPPFCIVYFWPQTVDLIQEPHTHAYNNFLFNEQFTVIKIHLGYSIKRVRERVWARITRVAARISIVN